MSRASSSTSRNMPVYQQGVQASGEFHSRSRQNSFANPLENRSAVVWQPGNYPPYPAPGHTQGMYPPPHGNQNGYLMNGGNPPPNGFAPYRTDADPALNAAGGQVLLSTVRPGPVHPQENQLSMAYAYGIQRSDGSFTRLVRADELPESYSRTYPISQGPEGLIIVPEPRQPSPSRRQGPIPVVAADVVASLPVLGALRQIPSQENESQAQHQIDHIVAQSSMSPPQPRQLRKEKVYCDKWIHEGLCAFTQMGCKYRHEMPTDRATQVSLGLTHGFPNWYRRTYAVQLNSPPQPTSTPNAVSQHSRSFSENWRRMDGTSHASPTPSNASYHQPGAAGQGRGSFGPIAPPPSQSMFSNNPYAALGSMNSENDGSGESNQNGTWRGRTH